MLTLIKWLFGLLFTLILLVVAAAIVLPLVIDPNDYKDQITGLVKEKTGRDFSIQQDLKLSVFPWLGVETGQVTLGNAQGFGKKPFAQIEQLGVKVKLLPLLQKQIEVDTLVLNGLQLNLVKNKKGVTNWADLQQIQAQSQSQAEPQESAKDTASKTTSASSPISFSVQGVQISNAQISWQDQQAGQSYQLNQFNLTTGGLYPGADSPIESSFQISSVKPLLDSAFQLKTQLKIGQAMQRFGLSDLTIKLDAKGPLLPKAGMQLDLFTQAALDVAQDVLMLKGLKINGPQIALTGDVTVKQWQTTPTTQAALRLQETNLKQVAKLFGVAIATQKPDALTRLSADMQVTQQGETIKVDPLNITLDASKLNGHLHVLETKGPTVRTVLKVDQINLDHYLPPASEATKAGSKPKPAVANADSKTAKPPVVADNPLKPLRTLDLVAEARVERLIINKMRLQDIVVKAVNKKGVLRMQPFNAKLYQGDFNGSITLNAQGKQAKIHAVKKLSAVQIGDLLKDLADNDSLLGQANVELDVRTTGLSESAIRNSLNGSATFKVLNGAYKGVNVAQLIRETGAALGLKTGQAASPGPKQTDFSELSGSAKIKNGVIHNQDLSAKSPLLRIDGKGQVNLPKDTIDYLLTTELVVSLEGQGGKSRDDLAGVPIPVKIEGPLQNPNYRPELSELISKKAEERIKREAEKAKQKIKQKIEQKIQDEAAKKLGEDVINSDQVKGLFKGLFGQ